MAGPDSALFFLVIPVAGLLVSALAIRAVAAAARGGPSDPPGRAMSTRFLVFVGIAGTPVLLGLSLWFLDLSVVSSLQTRTGSDFELFARLRLRAVITFAWTTCLMVATERWVASRRWHQ